MAAGQAPLGFWWLALPCLSALIWLVAGEAAPGNQTSAPGRHAAWCAAWLGWFGGAGYFAAAMFWIVEPFLIDVQRHGWMAPFALMFLSFGMALFWAAAAWLAALLGRSSGRAALAFAVLLGCAELTRTYVLTGFPWALIGHVWIDTPLVQLAALVGPVGLTLATTLAAAAPVALLDRSRGAAALGGVTVAVLLGMAWLWGQTRLDAPEPARAPPITVRLVQPNAPQEAKWQKDRALEFLERQLGYTAALSGPRPDLVIWPESSVPYLLHRADRVLELIAEASGGAPVMLGINRSEGTRYFNSLVVTGPAGGAVAQYDKHHLVPFGEYLPFGDVLARYGIRGMAAGDGDGFSAGPGPSLLDLGILGKVLPLICYEAVFPQDLRGTARPDWLAQVTNDAWFGVVSGPYQHLAQARLRAVEQGLPLVRVANTGVSAMIDAKGRVTRSIALDTAGFADAPLPAALPATVYARTGDLPVAVLLAILVAGLVLFRLRKAY